MNLTRRSVLNRKGGEKKGGTANQNHIKNNNQVKPMSLKHSRLKERIL